MNTFTIDQLNEIELLKQVDATTAYDLYKDGNHQLFKTMRDKVEKYSKLGYQWELNTLQFAFFSWFLSDLNTVYPH